MGCVEARVSEWSLSTLLNPIPKLQHALLLLKVLWVRECAPTPLSMSSTWIHIWILRGVGSASYTLCLSAAPTSKWFFLSQDSQGGVLKLSRFRFPKLCKVITFCSNLRLGWGLKKTSSSPWKTFQQCIALHLHAPRLSRFATFSGRESNCQFDYRPFFLR